MYAFLIIINPSLAYLQSPAKKNHQNFMDEDIKE